MMQPSDKKADRTPQDIEQILERVHRLPTLDNGTDEEILGIDESGASAQSEAGPGTAGGGASNAVEEFLKYRHRDWES
jgi:hypothetical protein